MERRGAPQSVSVSQRPVRNSQVLAFPLDDDLVLYEPASGHTYVLNRTGVRIWELADGSRGVGEIAGAVAEEFGVARSEALADVSALVAALAAEGLIALA